MLSINKSVTGACWHLKLDGVLLDTRCKKFEIVKLMKHYERKLTSIGL